MYKKENFRNGSLFLSACILSALALPVNANTYNESPDLNLLAKEGKLPKVEDRLPENPLVIKPFESIGEYGGTLNLVGLWGDNGHRMRILGNNSLFAFNHSYTEIEPNLATGFTANDDATEYTISLRKGLKWSNGEEFTADDIVYYINDVLGDPKHAGNRPLNLPQADSAKAELIDKYTVKIILSEPNGLFIRQLAGVDGQNFTSFNRNYCDDFQPKFNKSAEKNAIDAGFSSWREYYEVKCSAHYYTSYYQNIDRPTMAPWIVKTAPSANAAFAEYVRNPYFWQVDTAGNQLPYLDSVRWTFSENKEEMLLRAVAGMTDFQSRHIDNVANRPLIFENAKKSDYRVQLRPVTSMNSLVLALNQNSKDPIKAKLFAKKDFRIALSHAIDRNDINDTLFAGAAEPWQAAPLEMSPYFDKKMAKQYTEYDIKLANKLLDNLGLIERDKDGYRLMENGERVRIEAISTTLVRPETRDALEMVKKHWLDIGVMLDIRIVDRSLQLSLRHSMDFDMVPWYGDGGVGIIDDARWYVPFSPESTWGIAWNNWANGAKGDSVLEPVPSVKKQIELLHKLKVTADLKKQENIMKEIIKIASDNFYAIGTVKTLPSPVIVNNKLKNVPEGMPSSYIMMTPAPMRPGQLWKVKS